MTQALERATGLLDLATKEIHASQAVLEEAQELWELRYDEVAESLEQEYREAGRKVAPSKDAIESATRRQHRSVWVAYQRAKRRVGKAQTVSQNRRQQSSAYQTMMNNLGAEARVQDYLGQRDGR